MPITLRDRDLNQKLRSLAAETGTSPESLAEETLTRYFAAAADLGAVLEQRLRELSNARSNLWTAKKPSPDSRERKRNMQ